MKLNKIVVDKKIYQQLCKMPYHLMIHVQIQLNCKNTMFFFIIIGKVVMLFFPTPHPEIKWFF